MSYKISFENLGRGKATFSVSSDKEPDYDILYRHVKKHILSSEIDFNIISEENGIIKGRVCVGGFRPVGDFMIESIKENRPD